MFFSKKKNIIELTAPLTGAAVALSEVPDEAFAQGIIGDGIAIQPSLGKLVAPCDGIVAHLIDTHHAIVVAHDSGVEVMMHIGVNTVALKGEGFQPVVKTGDKVSKGQTLIEFDMELIQSKGYPVITPVIMANAEVVKQLEKFSGQVQAGVDKVMNVTVK